MASDLYEVDEIEEIARILFEPSMVERDDRISHNAFFLERMNSGDWEKYLSVWRTLYRVPTRDNAKTIKARRPGDKLYGYGTLSVRVVHSAGIGLDAEARVYRESKNPKAYHVGIFYTLDQKPIKGECDDPDFLELTMNLAAETFFHKFPPIVLDVLRI